MHLVSFRAGLSAVMAVASALALGCGDSKGGGPDAGGVAGPGGTMMGAGGAGGMGGGGGAVADSGTDGSRLSDCAGLRCGSDQQGVRVRSAALGATQCACVPKGGGSPCEDCTTCGQSICAQYDATCTGFSLETGLLCTQPG